MKTNILNILRVLATPISLIFGVSIHRSFVYGGFWWVIFIVGGIYTIWYIYDLFKNR